MPVKTDRVFVVYGKERCDGIQGCDAVISFDAFVDIGDFKSFQNGNLGSFTSKEIVLIADI